MPVIAKASARAETLDDDDDDRPTTIATDLEVATITSELDDSLTLIAADELPIARSRTSTSTVSAAARLAALKRTRS